MGNACDNAGIEELNENEEGKIGVELDGAMSTLLATLRMRVIDSKSDNPILPDKKAEEVYDSLSQKTKNTNPMMTQMNVMRIMALRTKSIDKLCLKYMKQEYSNGKSVIVTYLAVGLDSRFERIKDGKTMFFELDFPKVIDVRKQINFEENEFRQYLAFNVCDHQWMDVVEKHAGEEKENTSFIFIAEGLSMYMKEEEMKNLFSKLQSTFPGCHVIFDVFDKLKIFESNQKTKDSAAEGSFHFYINKDEEIETWGKGMELVEKWWWSHGLEDIKKVSKPYAAFVKVLSWIPGYNLSHRILVYQLKAVE